MSPLGNTTQKMKFSIKGFFSKCDQIRRKLWISSHLLKKFLMENFMFYVVYNLTKLSVTNQTLNWYQEPHPKFC